MTRVFCRKILALVCNLKLHCCWRRETYVLGLDIIYCIQVNFYYGHKNVTLLKFFAAMQLGYSAALS